MSFHYKKKCKDFTLLFLTRILRMFSYGMLAVVFFDNLFNKGINSTEASWLQSSIVFGDIFISLLLTTKADKIGRINTLMFGALLKLFTGLFYAFTSNLVLLAISGILGVISISGGQIGPFMPVEQSSLSQLVQKCTDNEEDIGQNTSTVFGYYNMVGYLSQAFGAAFAGLYIKFIVDNKIASKNDATHQLVIFYAVLGGLKFIGYAMMDRSQLQAKHIKDKSLITCVGIKRQNYRTIFTLSGLFAVDAFAGAFIVQTYLSLYFENRHNLFFDKIGGILFVCNIVSGISGVLSSKLVSKIGAMATMIYTHLPSNIFLLGIAFTTNTTLAIILLFGRFCISQMDVPARQTYVSMVVSSQQRSAANGITNIARSVGLCVGLGLNGYFISKDPHSQQYSYPFLIAGGLKIVYDVVIGCLFLWNSGSKQTSKKLEQQVSTDFAQTPNINSEQMQQKQVGK